MGTTAIVVRWPGGAESTTALGRGARGDDRSSGIARCHEVTSLLFQRSEILNEIDQLVGIHCLHQSGGHDREFHLLPRLDVRFLVASDDAGVVFDGEFVSRFADDQTVGFFAGLQLDL